MMTHSLFIQIAMIVLAGCIMVLYIQPAIEEIRITQDKTAQYNTEIERVAGVNDLLSQQVSAIDAISTQDKTDLYTYVPNEIDEIAVLRDLESIATEAGVAVSSLEYSDTSSDSGTSDSVETAIESTLVPHTFSLDVEGSYEAVKNLFTLLSVNKYQLQVQTADFSPQESDTVTASISLQVFSMRPLQINSASVDTTTTSELTPSL